MSPSPKGELRACQIRLSSLAVYLPRSLFKVAVFAPGGGRDNGRGGARGGHSCVEGRVGGEQFLPRLGEKGPGELGLAELTVFRVQLSVWRALCRVL